MTITHRFLVGTYTAPHGSGSGIHALGLTEGGELRGGDVVAACPSPSFLALHPRLPVLYAVTEHEGRLVVHTREDENWVQAQSGAPAGAAACHVRVDGDGKFATVACWGDGALIRYSLSACGTTTDRWVAAPVEPSRPGTQSRAHATIASPGGFISTDLGLDLLRRWDTGSDTPTEVDRLELPAGCGPRHLVSAGRDSLYYVVTEYSNEVLTVEVGDSHLALLDRVPIRRTGPSAGDSAAEISLSASGRWVTVGVRGADIIATLAVDDHGGLTPRSECPAGGSRPRHHLHTPAGLLVAAQASNQVLLLAFDEDSGEVGRPLRSLHCPSPTFILASSC